MRNLIRTMGVLYCALHVAPAWSQDLPDPTQIRIERINYGGSGCPRGSVGSYLSEDRRAFTLTFDKYAVEINNRIAPAHAQKDCHINIGLQVPLGWNFALFCVDFRGFADLDANVSGEHQSIAHIGSSRPVLLGNAQFQGPFTENYRRLTQLPLNQAPGATCDRNRVKDVRLRTKVVVKSQRIRHERNSPAGLMTMDTIDGDLKHHYGIAWFRCR